MQTRAGEPKAPTPNADRPGGRGDRKVPQPTATAWERGSPRRRTKKTTSGREHGQRPDPHPPACGGTPPRLLGHGGDRVLRSRALKP